VARQAATGFGVQTTIVMNKKVRSILFFILFGYVSTSSAQPDSLKNRYKKFIKLKEYMAPFWNSPKITDETLLVIRGGGTYSASLLFPAEKILSVTSTDHSKKYIKGKDWDLIKGRIIILPGSNVPFFDRSDLVFSVAKPGMSMNGKDGLSYVLFKEGLFFQSNQLSITYQPVKHSEWKGPRPDVQDTVLRLTKEKLTKRQQVKICFYGNSIETGYNSSGLMNGAPYMPSWPELVSWKLGTHFNTEIKYANPSVPGKMASWGAENAIPLVAVQKPDLVIVGFGMNDGASHVSPDDYRRSIQSIIDKIQSQNPQAEFVLISPMLANPNAVQDGIQELYLKELQKLSNKHVAVTDMTGVHRELLRSKSYQDMTGNNVNHPNDYLARWYAQMICGLLIK
jgi:lysophospholipase L1-like esterase